MVGGGLQIGRRGIDFQVDFGNPFQISSAGLDVALSGNRRKGESARING
jgi:hypothetical protein